MKGLRAIVVLAVVSLGIGGVSFTAFGWNPFENMAEEEALEIYYNCTEEIHKVGIIPYEEGRLTDAPGDSSRPAIAYNGEYEEFGVVWQDKRDSVPPINPSSASPVYSVYFTRVSLDGQKISEDILISNGLHDGRDPSIAWSPAFRCYLISWADARDCYMEYFYGEAGEGDESDCWPSPSGFMPQQPDYEYLLSKIVTNNIIPLILPKEGAFYYTPENRTLRLEGDFYGTYIRLKVKGDEDKFEQLTVSAYDGLEYVVPDGYTKINFVYPSTPETWYFPGQPLFNLEAHGATWQEGWYLLDGMDSKADGGYGSAGEDDGRGRDGEGRDEGKKGDRGRGERRSSGDERRGRRGNRSPAPPWIDVSITPDKLSCVPGEKVKLNIKASCSDNATIYKVTCELVGGSEEPKTKGGNGAKEISWDVYETLNEPGSYSFKATAYLYWDQEITAVDITPPINVQEPVLTPCNPAYPVSWQIYTRRVYMADPDDEQYPLGYTFLYEPVRITDPETTRTAWRPSAAWNEELQAFGLVWMENRGEGGEYKDYLFFNQMVENYYYQLIPEYPIHKVVSSNLQYPDYPSLTANDDGYVVVYQDKRPGLYDPTHVNNVYLKKLDENGPAGQEVKVSSAQAQEGSGGPWDNMYWDEEEGVFKFAETDKAWNGAMRPQIIRTRSKSFTVEVEILGEMSVSAGEDWLIITWEQEGKQYLARFKPGNVSKDTALGDVVVAEIGTEYFAPAVGAHVTDADALAALFKQASAQGGGLVALNYTDGDLMMSVHDYEGALKLAGDEYEMVSDNPVRVDEGSGFSGYPAVTWSDEGQVYGVAWEDKRFGQSEVYFKIVEVIDRVEVDCKPENDSGSSFVSCGEICDALSDNDEDDPPPPVGLPDEPIISVEIEEESSTSFTADLRFRIKALSAPGIPIDWIEYWISGHQFDSKMYISYINQSEKLDMPLPEECDGDYDMCPYLQGVTSDGRYAYIIEIPESLDAFSVTLPAAVELDAECKDVEGTKAEAEAVAWEKN